MLSDAKPKLQMNIEQILEDALYEAFITMLTGSDADPKVQKSIEKSTKASARKFAQAAAKSAGQPMANAIYEFVSSIGIMAVPKTLVSPVGPVTGVINLADFQVM